MPMRQPRDMGRTTEIFDIGLVSFLSTCFAHSFLNIAIYFTAGCPLRTENPCGFNCCLSQVFVDPILKETLRVESPFLPFWLQSVKCILKYLINNVNFIVLCKMFKISQNLFMFEICCLRSRHRIQF